MPCSSPLLDWRSCRWRCCSSVPLRCGLDPSFVWAFLYLVFVISVAASLLWFWLLARGEASVVSAYFFLTPIFGIGLAALLLGEPFSVRDGLGLGAVAAGIFLISRPAAMPGKQGGRDAGIP